MRLVLLTVPASLSLLLITSFVACDATQPPLDSDGLDTDLDDGDDDTDDDTGEDFAPFPTSFTSGQFRINKLQLSTDTDLDDDGTIDNNLPNALNLVDVLMASQDFSVESFNGLLRDNLDSWTTVVLVDAKVDSNYWLTMDLLIGEADEYFALSVDPISYDQHGDPVSSLMGAFTSETMFFAGPDDFSISVSFFDTMAPLPVKIEKARFEGGMTANSNAGTLTGALPIDELINKVIDPLLDPNGTDINGDGIKETKAQILKLIWSIAPSAGDVDLGNDRTGVSCRFTYSSLPATWD